jgi:hypothetical protein
VLAASGGVLFLAEPITHRLVLSSVIILGGIALAILGKGLRGAHQRANLRRLKENSMTVTNRQSGTNVHEVANGIYRINTPVEVAGAGGFLFNQYLVAADVPLLFHTGLRRMFPLVRDAVASILPVENLRYIACSQVEADECGSLNKWLAAAPHSVPLCGTIAAMVSINDLADRAVVCRGIWDECLTVIGTGKRWEMLRI